VQEGVEKYKLVFCSIEDETGITEQKDKK